MDCDQATTTASTSWHESKRSPCSFRTPEEIRLPRLCPIQSFTIDHFAVPLGIEAHICGPNGWNFLFFIFTVCQSVEDITAYFRPFRPLQGPGPDSGLLP